MSLRVYAYTLECIGFPRVSGDEPAMYAGDFLRSMFSPREWG